jgi:hypothetical protein
MELQSFGGKRRRQQWIDGRLEAMGGCIDGTAIIWRQEEASGMEWRWFGSKGRVQRWNGDSLEARECGLVCRQGKDSAFRDGMWCTDKTCRPET